MITLQDLNAAIAECQGERNPNANTCIKLAAFFTIKQEMFGDQDEKQSIPVLPGYSASAAPAPEQIREQAETYIDYDSGSEFSRAIEGMDAKAVWSVIDELMDVLSATNTRLYNGVMRKIREI